MLIAAGTIENEESLSVWELTPEKRLACSLCIISYTLEKVWLHRLVCQIKHFDHRPSHRDLHLLETHLKSNLRGQWQRPTRESGSRWPLHTATCMILNTESCKELSSLIFIENVVDILYSIPAFLLKMQLLDWA